MKDYTTLLEEALEAWEFTREGVVDELHALPDKELGFRPGEKSRSVIEIVQHIVESGTLMVGELTRSDGDFQRKSYEGFLHEYGRGISAKRTKAQLLDALKKTHAEGQRKFREVGEIHMFQLIRRFDGKMGTRFAWMNHGISHEEYHRGQLALSVRLLGRVPALTRRIEGK
jgi:uncharacterized damage-inducible protein DinB